jgi:hypothetical protein
MGKKPQRHTWDDARKLCRLNQFDVEMAKRLGLGPDSLVRARPDPRQRWKLPVKEWICELHFKRFGSLLYPQTEPAITAEPKYDRGKQGAAQRPAPRPSGKITDDDVPF